MPFCIYCWLEKPTSEFNTEHVLPRAFGRFANGLTRGKPRQFRVCAECNQQFGDELDETFARDSWEGIARVMRHASLGDPRKMKHNRVEVWLDAAHPLAPMRLRLTRRPGVAAIVCTPVAQLRLTFATGDRRCIEESQILRDVPTLLESAGQPLAVEMYYSSEDRSACARLTAKGRVAGITSVQWILGAESGSDEIEYVTGRVSLTIDTLVARAIAKIAFEYFVWNVAERFPLLTREELFVPIRQLIVCGDDEWQRLVRPTNRPILSDESATRRYADCHLIAMMLQDHGVVVRVSLFNDIVYDVIICKPPSAIVLNLDAGHRFDLQAKRVDALVHSRLLHPPPRRAPSQRRAHSG